MAITHVANDAVQVDLTRDTTEAIAFPSNTTAGSLLVICLVFSTAAGLGSTSTFITSIVDTLSNTWNRIGDANDIIIPTSLNRGHVTMFYVENSIGGACTVTVTFNAACDSFVTLSEFTGVATSTALDKSSSNTDTATAVTTGLSGTLSQADEVIVGVMGGWTGTGTITPDYTQIGEDESFDGASEYSIVAATTSIAATWTASIIKPFAALLGTFKAAAAGGSPTHALINGGLVNAGLVNGGLVDG